MEVRWKSSNKNYNKKYMIKISSIYPMLLFARDLADNFPSLTAYFRDHAFVLWYRQKPFSKRHEWFGS